MKKVLVASAALMLAGGLYVSAASAAAVEPGVKITGDARVRFWYQSEEYLNAGMFGNRDGYDSQTNMDSRVRLNITGTAAGGAYAKARIRMYESLMGDNDTDPSALSSASNIWVDMAYVGIPFNDQFTLEMGKYRSTYGPLAASYNFFYDDVHLTGFRGIIKMDNVVINPFVEWMEEAQGDAEYSDNKAADNDEIRYGVHVKAKINKDWTVGGMIGYQDDSRVDDYSPDFLDGYKPNSGFFGSLYTKGQSGAFGFVGELALTDGDLNGFNSLETDSDWDSDLTDNLDYIGSEDTGFGGYIFPTYTMDKLTVGLNLGFTANGFQPDRAFGFVMMGSYDNSKISTLRIGDTGDWLWAGLVTSYQINESLKLTGNLVYADIDAWNSVGPDGDGPYTKSGGLVSAGETVGFDPRLDNAWELSAILQYTISKGADVYFSAGYLKPEFEGSYTEDDGAFGALTRFELKF